MIKNKNWIFFIAILLIISLTASLVSASWFDDLFKGTGQDIRNGNTKCEDQGYARCSSDNVGNCCDINCNTVCKRFSNNGGICCVPGSGSGTSKSSGGSNVNPVNLDGYCTGNNSICINLTKSACITNADKGCFWIPGSADPSQSSFGNNFGLLGNNFLSKGGVVANLKNYEVKYDSNGVLVYEIVNDGKNFRYNKDYSITLVGNTLTLNLPFFGGTVQRTCGCSQNAGASCSSDCVSTYVPGQDPSCGGTCTGSGCKSTNCKWLEIDTGKSSGGGITIIKESKYDGKGNLVYQIMNNGDLIKGSKYSVSINKNTVHLKYSGGGGSGDFTKVCGCTTKGNGQSCANSCSSSVNPDGSTKCGGSCSGNGCSTTTCDWIVGTINE